MPDVERGQFADVKPYFWQTDTAVALNSWCYTEHNDFRPYQDILQDLVDIVSKNGCLLLNVGPRGGRHDLRGGPAGAAGHRPLAARERRGRSTARARGACTARGRRRSSRGQFSDGIQKHFTPADWRFTTRGGFLYATALKRSADGRYAIRALGERDASKVRQLPRDHPRGDDAGGAGRLLAAREEALHLHTDAPGDTALTFKLRID